MDGVADRGRVNPAESLRCPRCRKREIFEMGGDYICPSCGEIYYDYALDIWRVGHPKTRNFYNGYNDRNVK